MGKENNDFLTNVFQCQKDFRTPHPIHAQIDVNMAEIFKIEACPKLSFELLITSEFQNFPRITNFTKWQ